ncbi:hypothetical protein GCM10022225_65470 [Plantactinospora mayteni]|uniref:Uncharacterized protein n=1 Tax=Plantactinospora mayteni TaxID=566021 RepID=A0ABQ4F0E0_9ACTN|nr:hypothetical protein [Plantactinospora mayteni]GIH00382.1 hypothetical protein Pma05_69540 [Plantactinospora mayteni]
MSEHDWTEVVGAVGLFALVISVITTIIVQVARTWRAKAVLAREGEYKRLAETAVRTQEGTERQLAELGSRLSQMEARMTSLERVLKEVE